MATYYNPVIKVIDRHTRSPLKGAKFHITGGDANFFTNPSNSRGEIKTFGFAEGTYFYEDIQTPEGYEKIVGKIPFEIPRDEKLTIEYTSSAPPPPPPPPPPPEPQMDSWVQYYDVYYNKLISILCHEIDTYNLGIRVPYQVYVDGKLTTGGKITDRNLEFYLPDYIVKPTTNKEEIKEKLKERTVPEGWRGYLNKYNDTCKEYVKKYGLESLLDCLVVTKRMRWGEMLGFDVMAFRGTPDTDISYFQSTQIKPNITEFYCGEITVTNIKGLLTQKFDGLTAGTEQPTSKPYERVTFGYSQTPQSERGSWYCWQGKFELIDGFVGRRNLDKPLDEIIEIYEYYIPSLAYEPAIEPNRCGDLQDTEIALLKCPELSPACNDTYMFAGPVIQYQYYMQKKQPLKYDNYSYVRRDNAVNIEEHVDNIRGYNYCVYKNKGKYFYAFIMKKEYVNERTTRLYLATDVIQTFLFDFELEDSMVDRCHVDRWERGTTSTPTNEIEDEGLEFGDNKIWQGESEARYRVAEFQDTYIAVTSDPLGQIPSRKAKVTPEEGGGGN